VRTAPDAMDVVKHIMQGMTRIVKLSRGQRGTSGHQVDKGRYRSEGTLEGRKSALAQGARRHHPDPDHHRDLRPRLF
jgi:hypothetical protein